MYFYLPILVSWLKLCFINHVDYLRNTFNAIYNLFDPFISAHNVRQVYYVPYPATRRDKRGWCVAIKTKPKGYIEFDNGQDYVPYQVEEMSHVNEVVEV